MVLTYLLGEFEAVHARHADVADEQVRTVGLNALQCLLAIGGSTNHKITAQFGGNEAAHVIVIINNEHAAVVERRSAEFLISNGW